MWRISAPFRRVETLDGDVSSFARGTRQWKPASESRTPPLVSQPDPTSAPSENLPVGSNVHSRVVMKEAASLRTLLRLQGEQFVDCAYLTILRRDADEAGRAHYIQRLSLGDSKATVIYALYTSDEAKQRGIKIPWLRRLIVIERLASLPFIRILSRLSSRNSALSELEFRVSNLEKRANFITLNPTSSFIPGEPAATEKRSNESRSVGDDDGSIGAGIDPSEIPLGAKRVRKALTEAIASQ